MPTVLRKKGIQWTSQDALDTCTHIKPASIRLWLPQMFHGSCSDAGCCTAVGKASHRQGYMLSIRSGADLGFQPGLPGAQGGACPDGGPACLHPVASAAGGTFAAALGHQSPCTVHFTLARCIYVAVFCINLCCAWQIMSRFMDLQIPVLDFHCYYSAKVLTVQ